MKTIFLAASIFGVLALATPIHEEKRYLVTDVILETMTVTVTAASDWGPWKSQPEGTNAPGVTTSSTAAASFSPVAAPSESPSTGSGDSVSAYADPILEQHNLHRKNHSADPLTWDDNLADIALQIASSCNYAHNTKAGGGGYGQNIGAGAPDHQIDAMITNQMYNDEMMLYPAYGMEPDMTNFEKWGHFSQIVWKTTTKVGCYTQYCPNGLSGVASNVSPYFTVCNYRPAGGPTPTNSVITANVCTGNFGGQFAANVLEPLGEAMVVVRS